MSGRHAGAAVVAALLAIAASPGAAVAAPLPTRIGVCSQTEIKLVGPRLEGVPDSGTGVAYQNGGYQVSYEVILALATARSGDPVQLCLVSIPSGCPKGDTRGRIYKGTNLRTGQSWTAPDSQHMCGGA